MNNEKGFTLLELMATILIMGIIMSISLPTFTNSNKNISKKNNICTIRKVLFRKTSSDAIAIKKRSQIGFKQKWIFI